MVRRLNFPGTLQTEDPDQYLALVQALGGEDHGGTRLWWDTGNNNAGRITTSPRSVFSLGITNGGLTAIIANIVIRVKEEKD